MTDPDAPLRDEDLSADIDGEVTADVRARIADDATARDRQNHLRAAAGLVGQPVAALSAEQVDGLVAHALAEAPVLEASSPAAAGQPTGQRAASPPDQATDDADEIAAPRLLVRRRRLPPPWSVAATLVLLVGVGLALVWSGQHPRSQTTAERATATSGSAPEASAPTGGAAGSAAASGAGAAGTAAGPLHQGPLAPTTRAPGPSPSNAAPVDLGTFSDASALRAALATAAPMSARRSDAATAAGAAAIGTAQIERCAQVMENTGLPVKERLETATARIGAQPVIVYVYRYAGGDASARTLVVAVDPVACKPQVTFVRP